MSESQTRARGRAMSQISLSSHYAYGCIRGQEHQQRTYRPESLNKANRKVGLEGDV